MPDNTPKEAKNQAFIAYLQNSGKFDSVEVEYMQTGHTHYEQDQPFSTASSLLSSAPVLEDPDGNFGGASSVWAQRYPRGFNAIVDEIGPLHR